MGESAAPAARSTPDAHTRDVGVAARSMRARRHYRRSSPGQAGALSKALHSPTTEEEDGIINVVVWRDLAESQRRELITSRLLAVDGQWERVDGVEHLIASRLHDLTPLLGALETQSRDFR